MRILFSVWDTDSEMNTGCDDPQDIDVKKRVSIVYAAPHVHVQRFGGEGTGAQCFDDVTGWAIGSRLCMQIVHCVCGNGMAMYAAFVDGVHLATYHLRGGKCFGGFYSFIEDF